jgi:hypothetical protein
LKVTLKKVTRERDELQRMVDKRVRLRCYVGVTSSAATVRKRFAVASADR